MTTRATQPRSKKKLTPKQRVLRECPNAIARYEQGCGWAIQSESGAYLSIGFGTAREAWADAVTAL